MEGKELIMIDFQRIFFKLKLNRTHQIIKKIVT